MNDEELHVIDESLGSRIREWLDLKGIRHFDPRNPRAEEPKVIEIKIPISQSWLQCDDISSFESTPSCKILGRVTLGSPLNNGMLSRRNKDRGDSSLRLSCTPVLQSIPGNEEDQVIEDQTFSQVLESVKYE